MEASELNQILEQHLLWIQSNGVQGKCAYFGDAYLGGANLGGADLEDVSFINANLGGANLSYAKLSRANLRGANLGGANLENAYLRGAYLSDAFLYGANLYGANLEDVSFINADLHGANLKDTNLNGANLEGANLQGAILPEISWIIPGCLAHLNNIKYNFYLKKDNKLINFVQDSFGFFIQDNMEEKTFDMLVEDRVIRGIPDWVKYTGLKQIELV